MKQVWLYDYPESGTERVLKPLAEVLRKKGHLIDTIACDAGRDKLIFGEEVEYVHSWNLRPALAYRDQIKVPLGVTFHGYVDQTMLTSYAGALKWRIEPEWVHVMEHRSQMDLAMLDVYSHYTPQCVDLTGLLKQAAPEEITLGYLGGDPPKKRFPVVQAIGEKAGVRVCGWGGNGVDAKWLSREEVSQLHGKIGVFCSAHLYPGAGPIPPIEALACGRPVLATPCETLRDLAWKSDAPIFFFNGSVDDGVRMLKKMLRKYDELYEQALTWIPPMSISAEVVAMQFQNLVEEACG